MKRVMATLSGAELEVLRTILQEAGVRSVVRNEELAGGAGTSPINPELWVECDADFPKAHALFEAWCEPLPETVKPWIHYPERVPRLATQFDSC